MIDSLRLSISADLFDQADILWLRSLQQKLSLSNFAGDVVKWTMLQGVKLPSWFDGFYIRIGSEITIEGSPKMYQGHNVTGPDNLLFACRSIVNHIFGRVFGLASWPDAGRWYLRRMDITQQFDFQSFEAFQCWADTACGVSRGVRRASCEVSEKMMGFEGYGLARTLYIGKHSRYRAGKIYNKGAELSQHKPKVVSGHVDFCHELAQEFMTVGRFESVVRALYISDHAMDLGLVPDRLKGMDAGAYRENILYYCQQIGVEAIVTKSKEPLILFPVAYLSEKLDLRQMWLDEFHYLFSLEAAMDDATLISRLRDVCPTVGQAERTFDFLRRVRTEGLSLARSSRSKSQWYNYRNWLNAAGVSDAQLQDGAPLVRVALDPVKIFDFRVASERLRLIQQAHAASVDGDVARLHREVFPRTVEVVARSA